MKIMWLDVETTGLNREKCDIIQLSGIIVIDGEEKERFNFRCQPIHYENIDPTSFEKTGMTIEKLKELPLPQEMYINFVNLFTTERNINMTLLNAISKRILNLCSENNITVNKCENMQVRKCQKNDCKYDMYNKRYCCINYRNTHMVTSL